MSGKSRVLDGHPYRNRLPQCLLDRRRRKKIISSAVAVAVAAAATMLFLRLSSRPQQKYMN